MFIIENEDRQQVKDCLEKYYARCPKLLPVVPDEMRLETETTEEADDEDDWVGWKLVPSRVAEADVAVLEAELPFSLPPLFRAFLVTYFVLDMDFGDFLLPELPSDNPLGEVRRHLFPADRNLWQIGYAPFASGSAGDPVCFDLHKPTPDGDFAIVVINHDSVVSAEDWAKRECVEPSAAPVADSFRTFFTRLCRNETLA